MGLNFYYYDGLQPKMRAAIINEHECIYETETKIVRFKKSRCKLEKTLLICVPYLIKDSKIANPLICTSILYSFYVP